MDFFEDAEGDEAVRLDANGMPIFDAMYARVLYDKITKIARDRGCDCDFVLYVVNPIDNMVGMQLHHQSTCIGQMRQMGADGRN